MTAHIEDKSPRKIARTAGLWYLLAGLPAPLSLVYIPSKLIVPGDATATANNIHASEMLFRIGIVGNLVSQIGFIFVSLALYQLLKPVHKNMAVLMVILNLIGIPITMLNELTQFVALQLLSGAHYLTAFTSDQVHALALLFLNTRELGVSIAQIFWGLWLFPMGYLVFKSGFLPRIIGVLLMIGCVGYVMQSFATFLLPNLEVNIALLTGWGELLFTLWLLIRGVNVEQWKKRALASA
jgi:hypothetical protein